MTTHFAWEFPRDSELSPEGEELLAKMLDVCPKTRILPNQILEHPFMTKNKIPQALPSLSMKAKPSKAFLNLFLGEDQKDVFKLAKMKTTVALAKRMTIKVAKKYGTNVLPIEPSN